MHLEKVFELIDAFVGERHDAVLVEAADPDDAVLAVHAERDFVQRIFFEAELALSGKLREHSRSGEAIPATRRPLRSRQSPPLLERFATSGG